MSADRPTGVDLLAGATALLVPIAYLPFVDAPFWSPKVAVLLPGAAVGLTCVPALLRSDARRATRAGVALLVVASLSAVLSADVGQAVFGHYNAGTGLVFLFAIVGMWALGTSTTAAGRRRVLLGLVAGVGASAAVAVLQVVVDLGVPFLGIAEGIRPTGLAGNPVHLAALAGGVVALAATRVVATSPRWLVVMGAGAVVVQLSGSRFALLTLPLVVLGLLVRRGWRPAAAAALVVVVGLALGSGTPTRGVQETSSTERLTTTTASGGGVSARTETWLSARHSIAEHPLLGVGPGRFRAATSPHRSLELARIERPEILYEDAHNLVVEHVTTIGALGLAALVSWLGLALVRAREPATAAFAVAVLVLHLVQPQGVGTTPLLLLALGASAGGAATVQARGRRTVLLPAAAGLVALAASGALLVGDAQLQRARLDFDDAASASAVELLRPWPTPASVRARLFRFQAIDDPGGQAGEEAFRWRRVALARAPDAPSLWNLLAADQLADGDERGAAASFARALALDPWSVAALNGVARTNLALGRTELASEAAARSLLVVADQPAIEELLEGP